MHTIPSATEPTLADLKRVMIRMQIAALETLERCMADRKPSGDEKADKTEATKLNRQRMSATQALLHCRTMFREIREAEAQEHRIAQEKRQSEKQAIYDLANRRRLHQTYPGQYDDPDAPGGFAEGGMATHRVAMQDAESPEGAPDIATLRAAMRPEPSSPIPTEIGRTLAAQIVAIAGSARAQSHPA